MTAIVTTPVTHEPTTYSTEKKKGGEVVLDAAEKAALTSATDVSAALDICSEASKRSRTVTERSIGKASSVLS